MNIAANLTAVVERALPALSGSNVLITSSIIFIFQMLIQVQWATPTIRVFACRTELSSATVLVKVTSTLSSMASESTASMEPTRNSLPQKISIAVFSQKAAQRACVSECWRTTLKARQNSSMPPLQKVISMLSPTSL